MEFENIGRFEKKFLPCFRYSTNALNFVVEINRPKRRNPTCDAPLCVVSSFFPMGKEERGGAAQGGFLLLSLFTSLRALSGILS